MCLQLPAIMATCSVQYKLNSIYTTSSNYVDNQQTKKAQVVKEMDTGKLKDSIVSRRLAMELVGFNSVLLHVCPAHGALPIFGYSGATGPDKWGSLSPAYNTCSYGKSQSPIEIIKKDVIYDQNLVPLEFGYNDASATLINYGFNFQVHYENDVGCAIIDGKMHTLKQMHWHSPSEHTIDGIRYAAELHLVHTSAEGSISVVAILYKYGTPDPVLSQIRDELDQLVKEKYVGHEGAFVPIKRVRIKDIIQSTQNYFRYAGSLTTPPCSEKVMWTILREVREISKEQVASLKAPLDEPCKNNSRPTQPLNGRLVEISAAF